MVERGECGGMGGSFFRPEVLVEKKQRWTGKVVLRYQAFPYQKLGHAESRIVSANTAVGGFGLDFFQSGIGKRDCLLGEGKAGQANG